MLLIQKFKSTHYLCYYSKHVFTPEVHDSWYVRESDENAAEDEDGGLEVGQEEDGCKVDGHDREAHVPVKLASNDLVM